MANTTGQSKADDTSKWQNNKELNPEVNSSVTDDAINDEFDENKEQGWRPTDEPLESVTNSKIEDAKSQSPAEQSDSASPGFSPKNS